MKWTGPYPHPARSRARDKWLAGGEERGTSAEMRPPQPLAIIAHCPADASGFSLKCLRSNEHPCEKNHGPLLETALDGFYYLRKIVVPGCYLASVRSAAMILMSRKVDYALLILSYLDHKREGGCAR